MSKTYQDLLAEARAEVPEVEAVEVWQRLQAKEDFVLLDVRDPDEFRRGHLPGAVLISRGTLESRVERAIPWREKPIVIYCAVGERSLLAGRVLKLLGYRQVASLKDGIRSWQDLGYPIVREAEPTPDWRERYSRQIMLPQIGEEGQCRLMEAKVLVVGAGGLGSPAALYLAAAGVGKLGIVDSDRVEVSNLQRQILHNSFGLGELKAESARRTIEALNPEVSVTAHAERLDPSNVNRIIEGYDLVLDCADNFSTKYLLNDACYLSGKPLIYGSIFQFEGQATFFHRGHSPCYRCLFPSPPPPELVPT